MSQLEAKPFGRPRNRDHDRKIMEAVFAELATRPYSKLSVDDVARRAGVAKTTLYRRHPTKLELIRAAVEEYFATRLFALTDRDIGEVILDVLQQQVHEFGHTDAGRAMANLASEAIGDPELHDLLDWSDKRNELRRAIERGIERGEVRPDIDIDVVVDVLIAVFPYRLIVLQEPFPDDLARKLTALILDGVRVSRGRRSVRR